MRGATNAWLGKKTPDAISIHAPHAGRDRRRAERKWSQTDFNPRAPCGARQTVDRELLIAYLFQSTRPMRGATGKDNVKINRVTISIHAPHAGRDSTGTSPLVRSIISIHAPHAGRDSDLSSSHQHRRYFNPRAPCGARLSLAARSRLPRAFQSTRPMRGATSLRCTGA